MAHITTDPVLGTIIDDLTGGDSAKELSLCAALAEAVFSCAETQGSEAEA